MKKKSRWTDYRKRAYRPVRYLELVDGTVALMQAETDDHWRIFTTWNNGLIEKSQHFRIPSACHVVFDEICAELSAPEKDILVDELSETDLTPAYRAEVALELGRLEIADDEKNDGLMAKAERFMETHSTKECEAHIASELAAYHERRASQEETHEF